MTITSMKEQELLLLQEKLRKKKAALISSRNKNATYVKCAIAGKLLEKIGLADYAYGLDSKAMRDRFLEYILAECIDNWKMSDARRTELNEKWVALNSEAFVTSSNESGEGGGKNETGKE